MRDKGADYKKLLISRQLDKKKDLIRALFRACGDRTVGERYQSREVIRPVIDYDPNAAEKTIFEKVDTVCRPVLYTMEKKKIKWKRRTRKSSRRSRRSKRSRRSQRSHRSSRDHHVTPEKRSMSAKTGNEVQDQPSLSEAVTHRDFAIAYKIMGHVKELGMLENILNEEDTERVRHFFETELSRPTYRVSVKVMRLLHEAFNKCWERIMDELEKFGFDHETSLFLSEMEKAKASFLDVMLVFPEYIPESWGGRHIVEISLPSAKGLHLSTDIPTTSHLTASAERTSHVSQISQVSQMYRMNQLSQAAEERREKGHVYSPPPENVFASVVKDGNENIEGDSGREIGSKEGNKHKTNRTSALIKNAGRQGKTSTAEIHRKIPSAIKQRDQHKSEPEIHPSAKKKGLTGDLRLEPQKLKVQTAPTEKATEVVETKDHDLPKSPVVKESNEIQDHPADVAPIAEPVEEPQDEARENDEDEGENEEGEQNKHQEKVE